MFKKAILSAVLGSATLAPGAAPATAAPLMLEVYNPGEAANSAELIASMKRQYPDAGLEGALSTSAKVAKGEMQW